MKQQILYFLITSDLSVNAPDRVLTFFFKLT